jgi:hypothetical protein
LADTAWAERILFDIVRLGSETLCWLVVIEVLLMIIVLYSLGHLAGSLVRQGRIGTSSKPIIAAGAAESLRVAPLRASPRIIDEQPGTVKGFTLAHRFSIPTAVCRTALEQTSRHLMAPS